MRARGKEGQSGMEGTRLRCKGAFIAAARSFAEEENGKGI